MKLTNIFIYFIKNLYEVLVKCLMLLLQNYIHKSVMEGAADKKRELSGVNHGATSGTAHMNLKFQNLL